MATQLSSILSEINTRGLHQPNRYRVVIARDGMGAELEMFAQAVNIPGQQISSFEYPFENVMYPVKVPNGTIIEDVNLTFMLTNDFKIKKFFDAWLAEVVTAEYLLNYPAEYEQDIQIIALNQKGEEVYTTKIVGAYPLTVASIPLAFDSNDEYTKLDVTLAITTATFE
jgi:hypothetical protein